MPVMGRCGDWWWWQWLVLVMGRDVVGWQWWWLVLVVVVVVSMVMMVRVDDGVGARVGVRVRSHVNCHLKNRNLPKNGHFWVVFGSARWFCLTSSLHRPAAFW
jgi:hypothetical protein